MSSYYAKKDSTGIILPFTLRSSTTGQLYTSATSAGMTGNYLRNNAASVSLSFSSGAVGDAHSSGVFVSSGDGYFYHLSDVIFNAVGLVTVTLKHSGALDVVFRIQVGEIDVNDAVRGGMLALPNASANAAGGLITSTAGSFDTDALATQGTTNEGKLDTIDGIVDTLVARLTALRAGYLDKLAISGSLVADGDDLANITNNTRASVVCPKVMRLPDSGSITYKIRIGLFDTEGNAEAPDSAPTIAAEDESGNSRNTNLDSTTMTLLSVGRYEAVYTVADTHDKEQILFSLSVVEGGSTRIYDAATLVVDDVDVGFTASDRLNVDGIHTAVTSTGVQLDMSQAYGLVMAGTTGNAIAKMDLLSVTGSNQVEADLTCILGTSLTEDTAGNAATNFSTYYNNGDVISTTELDSFPTAAEIKTKMEEDGGKLDHLWETTEDNAGVRRFTVAALFNAPSGGGGGGDQWSTDLTVGGYTGTQAGAVLLQVQSAIASGISIAVIGAIHSGESDGFPNELVKDDEYSVANGNALKIRIYDANDTELTGVGSLNFSDANEFSIGLCTDDSRDTVEHDITGGTWVVDGDGGYIQFAWDADELDSVTDSSTRSYNFHYWGVKVSWASANDITVANGTTRVVPKYAT